MPKTVEKWGSISILSTMFTFLILGVLGWTGVGTLKAYDNSISVDFVKDQMTTMNQQMTEIIILQHEKNTELNLHTLRIEYCEKQIERCDGYHNAP